MKSLINKIVGFARNQALAVFLSMGMVMVMLPVSASASDGVWSLDSNLSTAQLFLGSAKDPDSVNVGVARVAGTANLDVNNLNNSVVDLSIYPADEDWGQALSPNGILPASYVPNTSDHTLLTFKSKRTFEAADGTLRVTGDLTLTRVERSVMADANVGYSGPVYGDPAIYKVTREITFAFPGVRSVLASPYLTPAVHGKTGVVDVSASGRIRHEDFRQLSGVITQTNWPTVIANETCQAPSTVGEDYHGATCTGTVLAATSADNCHAPVSVGEDYSGLVCTPPAGDLATIALQLKLTNANIGAAAEANSGNSAGQ